MSLDSEEDAPRCFAKALFSFNGKNNDELSFEKNDMIVISQKLDGGWWEGTVNGQTGWFPCNYVQILSEQEKLLRSCSVPNASAQALANNGGLRDVPSSHSSRSAFRAEVMRDFLTSEKLYISNLQETWNEFLRPLQSTGILSAQDWSTLACNFEEITILQSETLGILQETLEKDSRYQRVGGVLLNTAEKLQNLLLIYCENHPRAVEVMNEKEGDLTHFLQSQSKEMKRLISGLSEPFRHVDRYPIFLSELERNVQEDHPDRGDIQRSSAFYREMKARCEHSRKQKEMQLELLYTGQIEQWATFDERGKILFVGTATVDVNESQIDRCFAIFTKLVLVLEITSSVNIYKLYKKLPTRSLVVRRTDDGILLISGKDEYTLHLSGGAVDNWMAAFSRLDGVKCDNALMRTPSQRVATPSTSAVVKEPTPPVENVVIQPRRKKSSIGEFRVNHELEMILPEGIDDSILKESNAAQERASFLVRCSSLGFPSKKEVKMRKEVFDADDAALLRIVEGYCKGNAAAPKSSPAVWKQPQLIVAEQEKILMEDVVDGEVVVQEKSLVDTVYSLNAKLGALSQQVTNLSRALEREQRARRQIEAQLKRDSRCIASPAES